MPTTTREIWWLAALEATLFFSLPFWELTASYAEPTTNPFRFAAAILFAATVATLLFHIAPAFLATKSIRIPTALAIWLALGYTERIFVTARHSNAPWFCLAIILILAITYQTCARIFTVAALTLSIAILVWAVATTWHGHYAQNPHYSGGPVQLDGLIIQGMLVSAAPAVLIARQIGQRAPNPTTIWITGLFAIWLPMLLSVTAASLAAQAGATLHWALLGPTGLDPSTFLQITGATFFGPAVLSALALRSIAPPWQGRRRLYFIPLAAALFVTAAAFHAWHPVNLVNELAVPAYHLWALTIAILLILALLRRTSMMRYHSVPN
ncbi:MAG: hypothetical protein U0R19_18790 [Bryobacteraceae bacterium]